MFQIKLTEQQKKVISDHYHYATQSMRKTAAALNVSISTVQRVCSERGYVDGYGKICIHCNHTFLSLRPAPGRECAKLCPECAYMYAQADVQELRERLRKALDKREFLFHKAELARARYHKQHEDKLNK